MMIILILLILLVLLLLLQNVSPLPQEFYVDCNSQSSGNGKSPTNPCSTILCALSQCKGSNNDYIIYIEKNSICTSTGNENLHINETSTFTFIGQDLPENIIIESSLKGSRAFFIENAINITMINITIQNFLYLPEFNEVNIYEDSGGAIGLHNLNYIKFENMIFLNNTGLLGGSISITNTESNLQINNCIFENNTATLGGGALLILATNTYIKDSMFLLNQADFVSYNNINEIYYEGSGGGILFIGINDTDILNIMNSNFYNNSAFSRGGAIFHHQTNDIENSLAIYISNFYNNYAFQTVSCTSCDVSGGAIYVDSKKAYFENSYFANNYAGLIMNSDNEVDETTVQVARGGAIYAVWSLSNSIINSVITLNACSFVNNQVSAYGGALYLLDVNINFLSGTKFEGNIAGSTDYLFLDFPTLGGAIYFEAKFLPDSSTITNCYFINNVVIGGWGGAIYASFSLDAQAMNYENVYFYNNTAFSSYTFSSQGGAMMISSINASLDNCTFAYNSAQPIFLETYTFSGYGGAVFAQTAFLLILLSKFSSNYAFSGNEFDSGSGGGAIFYIHSNNCTIVQSTFSLNGAVGYQDEAAFVSSGKGGAIFLKFSAVQISENTIFKRNWASSGSSQGSQGGAIAVYESYSSSIISSTNFVGSIVSNSSFIQNVALSSICQISNGGFGQGGAMVFSDSKNFAFFNVTFQENVALSSSINYAETIGGALAVISNSFITISSSIFENNIVQGTGFGYDICVLSEVTKSESYGNLTVDNTMFSANSSSNPWTSGPGNSIFTAFTEEICNAVSDYTESSINYLNKFNAIKYKKYSTNNRYRDLMRKLSDIKTNNDNNQDRKHRRLRNELRDIISGASILISSGFAYFNNPSFITNDGILSKYSAYKIYVGDFQSSINSESSATSYVPAQLTIQEIVNDGNNLKLVVYKGTLQVQSVRLRSTSIKLKDLVLINSTLSTSNNLTISGRSYLVSSTINRYKSFDIGSRLMPSINFQGSIVTGLGINGPIINRNILPSFLFNVSSVYDGVTIQVLGNITVLPPFFQEPNTKERTSIYLKNNASIVLNQASSMKLLSGTLISSDSENSLALFNNGTIYLQGANELYNVLKDLQDSSSLPTEIDVEKVIEYLKDNFHFEYANYEQYSKSIYSPLSINGGFEQTEQGKIIVNVFSNGTELVEDNSPILYLTSNQSLIGTVLVNILSNTKVTLASATPDPTSWRFAAFKYAKSNAAGQASFVSNLPGFGISSSSTAQKSTIDENWVSSLSVSGLACEEIVKYYDFTDETKNLQLCSVCSMNSSCSICASSQDDYLCVPKGQCPPMTTEQENCCYKCKGVGVDSCQISDGQPTCKCKNNFAYNSNVNGHCAFPGLGIKIFLSLLGSFIFLILLGVFNYRYNKGQKGKVIEELRQNLLNSQDGIGNASNKTLKVIQSLQQDLILKDVFVRYEDLKLESKIGEGSYGIVYKATFRGAQVAVKQMRSPLFVDLTQKDIEEFRKEAYMMSRLRHPNIVLVMGISLIDIEPIRKRISSVSERTESSGSSKSKKESKRTVCIITEYLEQGSLADILYGPSRLPAEVWSYELILTCALQAARGMLYLHSHSPPICHRDLKCSNLVVDDHWVVKVTDFGMSRIIPEKIQDLDIGVGNTDKDVEDQLKYFFGRDTEASGSVQIDVKDINSNRITERNSNSNISISQNMEMTSNLGTTAWCAPELFTAGNTARYSVKVDVYSFGMVLWELWEKRRPFDNLTSRFDIMDAVREGLRPDINSNCPPAYRSLIERCWESEPSRRPMFKYIVRYLKEELAQVKRMQTATGPNRSISTDIATRLVNRVEDNEASSPSSLRANLKNILSWTQSKESTEKDTGAVPSSRAPLTIFDRGLSHLAGSPAVTSENITLAEQPLSFKNVAGGAGANRGAWRDRYVMKFSGWKTSQPDVGLPPSLGVGGNQTPNPMLSPQNYQDGTEIFDMECEGTGSPEIQLSSSNRSNK